MKLLLAILLLFLQASQTPDKWECCKDAKPLPKEQLERVKPSELKERVLVCAVPRLPPTFDGQTTLLVEVEVDEDGKIRCSRVVSEGQNPIMRDAGLAAAKQWRFEPLMVEGQAKPYLSILALIISWDMEKAGEQCPKEKRRA
jgi:hypothetical protein